MAAEMEIPPVVFKDRRFSESELSLVRDVVARHGGLSRQELANTVCELLDWRRPGGGLKTWECKELLAALEARGVVALPSMRAGRPRGARTTVPHTERGEVKPVLRAALRDIAPVSLRVVATAGERLFWRELVRRVSQYAGPLMRLYAPDTPPARIDSSALTCASARSVTWM